MEERLKVKKKKKFGRIKEKIGKWIKKMKLEILELSHDNQVLSPPVPSQIFLVVLLEETKKKLITHFF